MGDRLFLLQSRVKDRQARCGFLDLVQFLFLPIDQLSLSSYQNGVHFVFLMIDQLTMTGYQDVVHLVLVRPIMLQFNLLE